MFALPELPLNRLTEYVPGPAVAPKAPLLTVGDVSPQGAPIGTGATGVKVANPFAPGDSVTLSTPEKPAPGAGPAAVDATAAPVVASQQP